MNKKEEQQIIKITYALDALFDVALNIDDRLIKDNIYFISDEVEILKCKKELLENLEKIQKIVDTMLGIE